ncbi:hypothetical protein [Roseiterribacter gracilis]|uniref:Uncharacterized protein n=1 Tax=Roseiterribacter gracilis TaxID=2812848 RepID=A0A8S8X6G3_9PROT|nr:hypothetical protein TMPK1_05300 [Rhodospirillales bacterium TMPK1]
MTRTPADPLRTPDGRYIIIRGRLWRAANPNLSSAERERLTRELMEARRDVARAKKRSDPALRLEARVRVDDAKTALGERGPVWWNDGTPDYNRRLVHNTPYADWFAALPAAARKFALTEA